MVNPDANRPAEKKRAQRGAGRPAAIETEVTIATGREYIMGISPLAPKSALQFYTVDDIIRKFGGMVEYRKMLQDDAVKAALAFKKILVYGRDYDVDPASDSEQDKDIAEFVSWNLKRGKLKKIVREMLTAFEFGYSFGEILWERATYKGKTCYALKGVKMRDPDSGRIYIDVHGNVVRVEQWDNFGRVIELPMNKLVHYAHNGDLGNVYGQSDLRAVYKNWYAKKFIVNFWSVYLERLGAPTMLMKYPQGAGDTLKASLKNILQDLGNRAEIMVPNGVDVEVLESTRAGQATYKEALEYHDMAIARGILVPAMMGFGESGGKGSDSQSRLQLRTMFKIADEIGNEISDILFDQIIKQLVDFNFDTEEYPTLIWQDYGEFEATEIADVIRLLHNAGVIDMDQEDVNYVRSIVGLPVRDRKDDEDEVLRPMPAPQGTGANPPTSPGSGGASQGNEQARTENRPGTGGGSDNSNRAPVRAEEDLPLTKVVEAMQGLENRVLSRRRAIKKSVNRNENGDIISVIEEEVE